VVTNEREALPVTESNRPIRNYTFGINVETAEELEEIGVHVGKFIAGLGDGDCDIQVAINPALADGEYEERTPVIGFLADGNTEEIEYYEEDEGEGD